jgi:hypothetical protein
VPVEHAVALEGKGREFQMDLGIEMHIADIECANLHLGLQRRVERHQREQFFSRRDHRTLRQLGDVEHHGVHRCEQGHELAALAGLL